MNDSYSNIDCQILAVTNDAVLIEYDDGEKWIPKSVIENDAEEIEIGDIEVPVADWFIDKEM